MSTVHVAYHFEHGWRLIDEADYTNQAPDGPVTYCMRRAALNDGDQLRLRATYDRPLPAGQLGGLTIRAERWLLDRGLARKIAGLLLVDRSAVEKEYERLEAERREVA